MKLTTALTNNYSMLVLAVRHAAPESAEREAAVTALKEAIAFGFTPEEIAEYRATNPRVTSDDDAVNDMTGSTLESLLTQQT